MSSQIVGTLISSLGASIFFYYTLWVFVIPFIPSSSPLHLYFLDKTYAILIPQYLLLAALVSIPVLLLLIFRPGKSKTS